MQAKEPTTMCGEIDELLAEWPSLSPDDMLRLRQAIDRQLAESATALAAKGAERQRALKRLRKELAALPVHNPADGVSNGDHDRIVYGGNSSSYRNGTHANGRGC